jgi:hypothetical protein
MTEDGHLAPALNSTKKWRHDEKTADAGLWDWKWDGIGIGELTQLGPF